MNRLLLRLQQVDFVAQGKSNIKKSFSSNSKRYFSNSKAPKQSLEDIKNQARENAKNLSKQKKKLQTPPDVKPSSSKSKSKNTILPLALTGLTIAGAYATYSFTSLPAQVQSYVSEYLEPSRDVLLPELPPLPHTPKTLVLSLHDTLVHSKFDTAFGWRTAKRPGVDAFLATVAQMYEVVIFSSGTFVNDQPIVQQLDKNQTVSHVLYRDAMRYKWEKPEGSWFGKWVYTRDLGMLNRDRRNIIYVSSVNGEDNGVNGDYDFAETDEDNVVRISAWDDVSRSDDQELRNLGAWLISVWKHGEVDVRPEIRRVNELGGIEAAGKMVEEERHRAEQERNSGLGGLIRGWGR
eukprot:snap_masked-scaffold_8-processed-gene-6.27-mRNA-1 protein AED:1.00 eAED:1.00 QI:0/-1/0/0/-1/1/1/0/348